MQLQKLIYVFLIIFQITTISWLGFNIHKKLSATEILGEVSISTIDAEETTVSKDTELKYYYERVPQKQAVVKPFPGYMATYSINDDTLNERYDYEIKKPSNVFRIVTLGDSFTYGDNVSTQNNWTEILEDDLNSVIVCPNIGKIEVVNLGMSGYGVEYIAHRYKTRGTKYSPNLIVWLESGTGFNRINELFMPLVKKYEAVLSEEDIKKEMDLGNFFPTWTLAINEVYGEYSEEELSDMVGLAWKKFFSERGETPVVVSTFITLPNRQKDKLQEWASGVGNVYLNFEITDIYNSNLFLPDRHPNDAGHKTISNDIFKYLAKTKLIACH